MKAYWTITQTQALKQYQQATDMNTRNQIFETTLLPALLKLIECVMAKASVTSTIDKKMLSDECLTHCVTYLDRIDCSSNPFAYLSLAVKHFIYQECYKRQKLNTRDVSLDLEDRDGEDCIDLIHSQIPVSYDNNPVANEDTDVVLQKVLDYWTEAKVRETLKCIQMCTHKRNRVFNAIKYYLYKLGSPHIKFERLNTSYKKHTKFNPNVANGYLNYLAKESNRKLLDK